MRRVKNEPYIRGSFEELPNLIPFLKKKRIAPNLPDDKALVMANIYECLMDYSHKIIKRKFTIFNLKEDMGVKKLQIGTPGGGYYGPYRRFKIKVNGEERIAGIGMNRYSKVRTILCVALQKNDESKAHHSLQLAVDDYMRLEKKSCFFIHKGNIGLGALGSGKNQILREKYVEPFYPKIIDGNHYLLGKLPTNRLLYVNGRSEMKLIENLISYAIIRDMYREDAIKEAALNSD